MDNKKIHISIFGGGNVATHLIKAFLKQPSIQLQQVYNRHIDKIKSFTHQTEITDNLKDIRPADIFILALTDDAIAGFSKKLSTFDTLTVHTSGSTNINALQTQRKGVFYPFQTFSKDKEVDFRQIPILVEAQNQDDLQILKNLAQKLSAHVIVADSNQRKALHVAGVFAANFVNHLYLQAAKILEENKLDFDLLKPLIMEVAHKIEQLHPKTAQTGPAIRNDQKTIEMHLKFLKNPEQKELYRILTQSIQKTYSHE